MLTKNNGASWTEIAAAVEREREGKATPPAPAAMAAREEACGGWEEPIPLDGYELPGFPVSALPAAIGDYCQALAESTQTPVDMACVCALAVIAVAAQGKCTVRVNPDWREPVNIYVVCAAPVSARKSSVLAAMCAPLDEYERKWNRVNAAAIVQSSSAKRVLENRQHKIEVAVANGRADDSELREIS